MEKIRSKMIVNSGGQKKEYDSKILIDHLQKLVKDLQTEFLDLNMIEQKVQEGIYNNITTKELAQFLSETLAYCTLQHPDYSYLASRVCIKRLHKTTNESLVEYVNKLQNYTDVSNRQCSLLNDETYKTFLENEKELQSMIDYSRDFNYDFFGLKTLEKSYLLRVNGEIAERPQQLLMRVAVGIHGDNMTKVKETYDLMSSQYFIHATPTLFNAGTKKQQMSSCFLLSMTEDSIDGIYETLKRCAHISKSAGGIGISVSNIRAKGSYIRGTNGYSNGLVPMLRVYDSTARYVDQGGGRRKGSFAIYMEPWHADIFDFLELKKNHGKEELRARDLFYGLYVNDLFMKRVENNQDWTLMCPAECPNLIDKYGEEFEELYTKYEKENRGRKTIKARDLWNTIVSSQVETGTPYMVYKDACNKKSNQKNLGTIRSSNLCTEIIEYTSKDEVAVCNLASIALPKFVDKQNKKFNFEKLIEVTSVITYNLNKIIDKNFYPVKEAENSNLKHRPIGIGVQGLADVFAILEMPYDSKEALELNNKIFETIYYGACQQSMQLAKIEGPYQSFKGSPASEGLLQFDLWNKKAEMYDWETLKKDIQQHGMRNSLLLAPMPTASTSQILGNNETFEAFTSNIYSRRVLSGEFICVNKHLIRQLIEHNLWNKEMINEILSQQGSIQRIQNIPQRLKDIFKTVWELQQKVILDLAIGRAPFIDQSQSLNIFLANPDPKKIKKIHFYGWKNGLKTGMYYLRSKPAVNAIQFTVDQEILKQKNENSNLLKKKNLLENEQENKDEKVMVCRYRPKDLQDDEECLMCGS